MNLGSYWIFGLEPEAHCGTLQFKAAMTILRRLGRPRTLQLLSNQIELTEAANEAASTRRWRDSLKIIEGIEP